MWSLKAKTEGTFGIPARIDPSCSNPPIRAILRAGSKSPLMTTEWCDSDPNMTIAILFQILWGAIHANPSANADTHLRGRFWPVKVDGYTVALKNIQRNRFCSQQSDHSLSVDQIGITEMSRLTLEELVLSRRIYNMDFDFANAIIYGETPVTMATANSSNNTATDNTVEFRFAHTES